MSSDIAQLEQAAKHNECPFYLFSPMSVAHLITYRDNLRVMYGEPEACEFGEPHDDRQD